MAIQRELGKVLKKGEFFTHALDFGCGWGRLTPQLVTHCSHLWAADLFTDWTGRAAAVGKSVTPVTLSSYELPFDDGAFDLVVDIMTLQSVNEKDWRTCANELSRVTATGGTIISLMKHEMVEAGDHEIVNHLGIEASVTDIDTIDKKRELYCLIRGTRL